MNWYDQQTAKINKAMQEILDIRRQCLVDVGAKFIAYNGIELHYFQSDFQSFLKWKSHS